VRKNVTPLESERREHSRNAIPPAVCHPQYRLSERRLAGQTAAFEPL
jgi:hypothetical protein